MKNISMFAEPAIDSKKNDLGLIISIILLIGFGLVTLYVTSPSYASRAFGDELYFLKRQVVSILCGLVLMIAVACINMDFLRKMLPVFVIGVFILCLLTFIPGIGVERNGARRWIRMPLMGTFQPSEAAKVAVIIFLANIFDKKSDRMDEPGVSVYPAAFGLFSFVLVVFLQDDFSTAIFILLLGLLVFFVAGVFLRWFTAFCIFAIPVAILFVFGEEYRVNRLIAFLRPDYDINGINFQLNASRRAISAGGVWGQGIGTGLTKVNSIPEIQADFIFAGWVESMGFFGVLVYFALLAYFAYRVFSIAIKCTDKFRSLIAFGCGATILIQSIVNCGVVSGAFPSTGIPLPFFSSGGSSMLMTLFMCGLLINVSRYENVSEIVDYE